MVYWMTLVSFLDDVCGVYDMGGLLDENRLSATRATAIALLCTISEVFDVPVYWPILVMYFFVLFVLTMRRQIQCVFRLS